MNLFSLGFWGSTLFSSEFCLLLFWISCWSSSSPWLLNMGVPRDSILHSSLPSGVCSQDTDYHLYTYGVQMSLSSLDLERKLQTHISILFSTVKAPLPQASSGSPFPSVQKSALCRSLQSCKWAGPCYLPGLISLHSTFQKALSTSQLQVLGFCCFLPQISAVLAPDLST